MSKFTTKATSAVTKSKNSKTDKIYFNTLVGITISRMKNATACYLHFNIYFAGLIIRLMKRQLTSWCTGLSNPKIKDLIKQRNYIVMQLSKKQLYIN